MTLGNIRSLGVYSLFVTCELCHHQGVVLPAERWPNAVPRMMRTRCRIVGADVQPGSLR